jgi:hypothetical protein
MAALRIAPASAAAGLMMMRRRRTRLLRQVGGAAAARPADAAADVASGTFQASRSGGAGTACGRNTSAGTRFAAEWDSLSRRPFPSCCVIAQLGTAGAAVMIATVTVAVVPTTAARRYAVAVVVVAMVMPVATVSSLCLVLLGVSSGELDVAETVGEGGVV